MAVMARDIRRRYLSHEHPLLVAHPSLVGMLAGRPHLYYQHGELIAPPEAIVPGATGVFVPTSDVAEQFADAGYRRDQVVVSGLCIERALVDGAETSFETRLARYESDQPLTGLFISSGAEPQPHLEKLLAAAASVAETGGEAVILARSDGRLARACRLTGFSSTRVRLEVFADRREEENMSARWMPRADYLVGPSHERTNWALGLGLPIFVLMPTVGPFAPRNLHLILQQRVGRTIPSLDDARRFGSTLAGIRADGGLRAMASAGFGKVDLRGFDTIARYLQDNIL
jgi:hypothetical protein